MPSDYDVWLLDLDGTIVDASFGHVRWVFDEVGDRLGRRFTDEEAERLWNGLCGEPNDELRRMGVDPGTFWQAFHEVEDPDRRAAATTLYEDAAVVAEVDSPTALVTHCQSYLTEAVLEIHGIADWFDAVVCCDDDVGWKPDPAPVERALRDLGVRGDVEGVLVGDTVGDVGAAWNAGLDAAHVERFDHDRRRRCVLADYRVSRLDELPLSGTSSSSGDTSASADD